MADTRDVVPIASDAALALGHFGADASVPVVFLNGEFDIENVPDIDRFLRRSLGPLYFKHNLVLDLKRVTFVDSSFLGFVVTLVRRLQKERQELLLTRPVGAVRRTLAAVGLPNVVPVYDSLAEAVSALVPGLPLIPPPFDAGPRTLTRV